MEFFMILLPIFLPLIQECIDNRASDRVVARRMRRKPLLRIVMGRAMNRARVNEEGTAMVASGGRRLTEDEKEQAFDAAWREITESDRDDLMYFVGQAKLGGAAAAGAIVGSAA